MKNEINLVVTPSANKPVNIVHATMLSLACLTGCASESYGIKPGDIPSNTQLALSPNGQRLLVSWNDSNKKLHAKLVELNGSEITSTRDIELPPLTFTTAFANNNEQILLTTIENKASELLTFNLSDNRLSLIYRSERIMRFPLEVNDGNYVFLEGTDPDSRMNQWQRYQGGKKTLLNPKNYNSATRVDVVNGALFILEPWSPPAFRNLYGELPKGLSQLIDSSTFNIVCADKNPLVCVRDHLLYDGPSYGIMEILNGNVRCDISGRWIDSRELQISRDGSVVVFHAAIKDFLGPRSIFVVKNEHLKCSAHSLVIGGN
jgi:hypothetical protein